MIHDANMYDEINIAWNINVMIMIYESVLHDMDI